MTTAVIGNILSHLHRLRKQYPDATAMWCPSCLRTSIGKPFVLLWPGIEDCRYPMDGGPIGECIAALRAIEAERCPPATTSAPGSPVVSEPSNGELVVPKSINPDHEWSPQASAALDAVRKRLGADGRKR